MLELQAVFDSLNIFQQDIEVETSNRLNKDSPDLKLIEPLIYNLYEYVKSGNTRTQNIINKLEPLLVDKAYVEAFINIRLAVENYDVDMAIENIQILSHHLGIKFCQIPTN